MAYTGCWRHHERHWDELVNCGGVHRHCNVVLYNLVHCNVLHCEVVQSLNVVEVQWDEKERQLVEQKQRSRGSAASTAAWKTLSCMALCWRALLVEETDLIASGCRREAVLRACAAP